MAVVDTSKRQKTEKYDTREELIRTLKMAVADELSADTLYDTIVASVEVSSCITQEETDQIMSEVLDIRDDEVTHQRKLLALICSLSPAYVDALGEEE